MTAVSKALWEWIPNVEEICFWWCGFRKDIPKKRRNIFAENGVEVLKELFTSSARLNLGRVVVLYIVVGHVCVYLLKLLYANSCVVWRSYHLRPFYFVHFYMFVHFSAACCTAHCALELGRDRDVLLVSWFVCFAVVVFSVFFSLFFSPLFGFIHIITYSLWMASCSW